MKVTVEEYQPRWATQFQHIKHELEDCLQGISYLSIEHVGSTSVPGIAAKPVLDIDIVIYRRQLSAVTRALTTTGSYEHKGDCGIPDREVFRTISAKRGAKPARNLYVCIHDSQALRNHLAVRDLCRRDEHVRETYASKKRELAALEWRDVDAYCEAKDEVLL